MNTLFVDTLEIAVPMSVLIGVLLLVSPLIKKSYVAKWRYFMWLFVAVRLILPFKISVFSAPITMELPNQISGMPVTPETVINNATPTAHVSVQSILMAIWLIGIAVFALYQFISYFSFKRTVKRWSVKITDEKMVCLFNEIKESMGEKRRLDLRLCKTASTPMVFGFFKPVLLMPYDDYTEQELRIILRHELIHFRRNDIYYKLVLLIANAMNWFNPLVYMMVNAANKDIELACDAEVVKEKNMEFRREYCRAILTVIHNKQSTITPLSTCFIISRKVIQERFRDILDLKKKRRGIILFAVVALSIIISGSLVTFATEKAADVLEEDFRIVERPTPKPKPTQVPVQTPAPVQETVIKHTEIAEPVREVIPPVSENTELTFVESAEAETEPTAEPAAETEPEKPLVDLSQQSNMINISFNEAGEVFTSSNTYIADADSSMVIVSDGGNCTVQVVNDVTGEVVQEQDMTEDNNSLTVPMENGSGYSINAVAAQDNSNASIYVYGK